MSDPRTERIRPRLDRVRWRCPACGAPGPAVEPDAIACAACGARHPLIDGRPHFVALAPEGPATDPLDRLKHRIKRHRRLYAAAVWLLAPLYFGRTRGRFLDRHVRGREGLFVNLGSGNTRLDPRIVNVDHHPYDEVDVVSDLLELPFADGSVDLVLDISVLEHVPDPGRVVREIERVLRPGGLVYSDVPFLVGFHASPHDFHRWTRPGVLELHRAFEPLELVPNGGPTSALLWTFQEWIALALSFGSRRLHLLWWGLALVLTFPIKFLDLLLARHPLAHQISSCFIFVGRKRGGSAA